MRLGVFSREFLSFGADTTEPIELRSLIDDVTMTQRMGFNSYWLPQQVDLDALMVAPRLSMAAPALEIGVGVVPMQSRFPVHMAQAARTADFLSPGPFTLGLGVEHDWVVRDMWGLPFDRPVTEMTEYLRVVLDLLRNGASQHQGDFYRVSTFTSRLPPAPRLPVLLGALGPRMLDLAGSVADGTITWLAGVETVTSHIVPRVTAAAERAERPTTRQRPAGPTQGLRRHGLRSNKVRVRLRTRTNHQRDHLTNMMHGR